jgi:hypothetical protein
MWPYGMNQQPFIIMPTPGWGNPSQPSTNSDPMKAYRKMDKWIKKYQEAQKAAEAAKKKPDTPKTPVQKFFGEKSATYWDVAKYVVAFGPIGTYLWAMTLVYMAHNLRDAVTNFH